VNAVSPGPVLTNLADGAMMKHPEYLEPLASQTALGRIGQPDDVGSAIAALLVGRQPVGHRGRPRRLRRLHALSATVGAARPSSRREPAVCRIFAGP
jgi:NAD(P)-dependent dehydrogenase (short-subunit alcohol dehydrogenase family)